METFVEASELSAGIDETLLAAGPGRVGFRVDFEPQCIAGFSGEELDVTVQENTLLVTGKAKKEAEHNNYLHRGIARRAFERRFSLADHIKVVGASLSNGMLHVDLTREVPEASKPRKIEIGIGQPKRVTVAEQPEVTKQAA